MMAMDPISSSINQSAGALQLMMPLLKLTLEKIQLYLATGSLVWIVAMLRLLLSLINPKEKPSLSLTKMNQHKSHMSSPPTRRMNSM